MATPAKALPEMAAEATTTVGVLNEQSFFLNKKNSYSLRMESYRTQKTSLEAAIQQNSENLKAYIDAKQEQIELKADNEGKLRRMIDICRSSAAKYGIPITVQDVQKVNEAKAAIRASEEFIEEYDEAICIFQANISDAQAVLKQVEAAIQRLNNGVDTTLQEKSQNSPGIVSPRQEAVLSDAEGVHTGSDEAHSDQEHSDSESSQTRHRMGSM